jgi:hypothetical protein
MFNKLYKDFYLNNYMTKLSYVTGCFFKEISYFDKRNCNYVITKCVFLKINCIFMYVEFHRYIERIV